MKPIVVCSYIELEEAMKKFKIRKYELAKSIGISPITLMKQVKNEKGGNSTTLRLIKRELFRRGIEMIYGGNNE